MARGQGRSDRRGDRQGVRARCAAAGAGGSVRAGLLAGLLRRAPAGAEGPYRLQIEGDGKQAVQLWRERGCSYQAALALGDSEDRLALRQALDELRALGAWPAATMVARRLRELGERSLPRGPRPRTRANPAGHHVSAILRKLGVRSRMQAAAEAARLGIGDGLGTRDEPARLGIGDGLGTRDEPANGHASRS